MFTGQAGYAWNNVLLYLKGGAAFTHDKYGAVSNFIIGNVPAGTLMAQAAKPVGGELSGLRWHPCDGWRIYLSRSITQDVDMGTVRVNYTFGAPVVAKY